MKTTFNNEEFMKIQQKELLDALYSAKKIIVLHQYIKAT